MKTKDEILRKYEDEYEYHFHEEAKKLIFKAMEKYAIELIREKLRWRDAEKELPELLPDENFSKNVFAKIKGSEEVQIMCLYVDDLGNELWTNCYGDINGDGILDDDYEVVAWKHILL